MKTIAIRSINSESIIIVSIDSELQSIIRKGKEVCEYLRKQDFKEGVILKIPFTTESIKLYDLGTIYKSRLTRDENICESNFIEYLILSDEERIDFAKEYSVNLDWFVKDSKIELTNFSDVGFATNLEQTSWKWI